MKHEAFCYRWVEVSTGTCYVGYHIGSEEDAYVSSSDTFNAMYEENPNAWSREILAHGTAAEMLAFETGWLQGTCARTNPLYLNKWENNIYFVEGNEAQEHSREFVSGKLEDAGWITNDNGKWFMINIDGFFAYSKFINDEQEEYVLGLVNQEVKLSCKSKGKFHYFDAKNLGVI